MTIYSKKRNSKFYRKLWEQHHGRPIPKDETGRTFDIHHIDGDHTNNSIENLYACPIQEHYDIHLKQEDWGACYLIARRMKLSPELLSELNRKAALKRVEDKTHNFQKENGGSELARKNAIKRVEDKTHHWQKENGGSELSRKTNLKRVEDKTHHLLKENGGSELARKNAIKRVEDKTHHFLGNVICKDKQGNVVQVPKEVYQKQKEVTKDMSQWEFVTVGSFEAKKRKPPKVPVEQKQHVSTNPLKLLDIFSRPLTSVRGYHDSGS